MTTKNMLYLLLYQVSTFNSFTFESILHLYVCATNLIEIVVWRNQECRSIYINRTRVAVMSVLSRKTNQSIILCLGLPWGQDRASFWRFALLRDRTGQGHPMMISGGNKKKHKLSCKGLSKFCLSSSMTDYFRAVYEMIEQM